MHVWYEGSVELGCNLEAVKAAVDDPGELFVGIVAAMRGMSEVTLVEQGDGFVTIRTNEGTMRRTNISRKAHADGVVMEFDEEYDAGKVTVRSHFREEYTASHDGVRFLTTVSDVRATGLLGFFYRRFGARSMGKAFLASHKAYLEGSQTG